MDKTTTQNNSSICPFPSLNFNGKEKDWESSFHYFGARYYWSEVLTGWLSVDPMVDKYPNISPYAYCVWNPMKLVDPEGKDVWTVSEDGHIQKSSNHGGSERQIIVYANGKVARFKGGNYHTILSDLSSSDANGISSSYGDETMQLQYANVFKSMSDNTNVEWRMERYSNDHYSLGTKHSDILSPNSYDLSKGQHHDKDVVTLIHSHPCSPTSIDGQISSMGYWYQRGELRGDAGNKNRSLKNANYYTYFPKTKQLWSVGAQEPAYIRSIKTFSDFFFGTYNSK